MQNNSAERYYAGIVSPNGNYVIGKRGGAVSCAHAGRARQFDSVAEAQAALPAWLERQASRKNPPPKCGGDTAYHTFVCPTTDIVYPSE